MRFPCIIGIIVFSVLLFSLPVRAADEATEHLQAASEQAAQIPEATQRLSVLSEIAVIQFNLGQIDAYRTTLEQVKKTSADALKQVKAMPVGTLGTGNVLASVVEADASAGAVDEARQALELLSHSADDSDRMLNKPKSQKALAAALARFGQYGEAQSTADAIEDNVVEELAARRSIIAAKAKDGDFAGASALAKKSPNMRYFAHFEIVSALAQAGKFDEADEAAKAIGDGWERLDSYAALAMEQSKQGDSKGVMKSLNEASKAAEQAARGYSRIKSITKLAVLQTKVGQRDQALKSFELAKALASEQSPTEKARATTQPATQRSDDWNEMHIAIAKAQAEADDISGALTTLRLVHETVYSRASALESISFAQLRNGDWKGGFATMRPMVDYMPSVRKVAHAASQGGCAKELEEWMQALPSAEARAWAHIGIVDAALKKDLWRETRIGTLG